uniref:E3 ubiquitin-protein ligase NEURL3-like n=1 Tax=Scatophagus argus TaxID=75038 RepID=UPI001ED85DD7|nr:E3 ubiquitin-protein ligase NEURL3-like [Scatophagus argus]
MTIGPRHRCEHIFSQDTKKRNIRLFNMLNSDESHRCGLSCLGPLTFHRHAVGNKVILSEGCRLAERKGTSFNDGLVFSSREVKIQERIRLRVEKVLSNWHGALRVGFTNVAPSARCLPLAPMAIPNLTDIPSHWAAPIPESICQAGSELEFWVSHGGAVYVGNDIFQHKLLRGVDISQPLWAMIDIYGQTRSIYLLGSKKREAFHMRRSCPAPKRLTSPDIEHQSSLILDGNYDGCMSCLDMDVPTDVNEDTEMDCVVCMERTARVTLPCGHQCLCRSCASRVIHDFGVCPLCRCEIRHP